LRSAASFILALAITLGAMPAPHALSLERASAAIRARAGDAQVQTQAGIVQGKRLTDGTYIFRGLPFAKPPLGALRWRPPEAPMPWIGVRQSIARAPSCPQTPYGSWNAADATRGQEDCLYLDVRTPTLQPTARRPVMVWIHGGGNRAGSMGDTALSSLGGRGVVLAAI
jgi:para-nitrobenzyl esterase